MLTIITMPDPSTLISDIGSYASPFFSEFYNVTKAPIGVIFAAGLVTLLIGIFIKFIHSAKQ